MTCRMTAALPRDQVVAAWLGGAEIAELVDGTSDDGTADFDAALTKPGSELRNTSPRRPFRPIGAHDGVRWSRKQTRARLANSPMNRQRLARAITETADALRQAKGANVSNRAHTRRISRQARVEALREQAAHESLLVANDVWRSKDKMHAFSFAGSTTLYACDDIAKLRRLLELGTTHSQPGRNRQLMRFAISRAELIAFDLGRTRVLHWHHADSSLYPSDGITLQARLSQRA